jgi:hypothetical protein
VRKRGGDGLVPLVAGHEAEEFFVRRRVRGDGECLRRLQGEAVQALQGTHDRGAGAGAGRELREVRGDGGDEVGAAAQQRGEGGVVLAAECLRE